MPKPLLEADDPNPAQRAEHLADKREDYQLDFSYHGFGLPKKVPHRDGFGVRYLARATDLKLVIAANHAASGLLEGHERVHDKIRALFNKSSPDAFADTLDDARATITRAVTPTLKRRWPLRIDEYDEIFQLLPAPRAAQLWDQDWYFAYDRLGGVCPHELTRIDAIPEAFPVTQAHYARTFPTDTLEAALAQGRIFITTYPILEGIDVGPPPGSTHEYFLTAPMVLYAVPPPDVTDRRLMPVAIQLAQRPGPQAPIFTPAHGIAWRMAKTAAQIADRNKHGIAWHGGRLHFMSGGVVVVTERHLPDCHPVHILLRPNFEFNLAIVDATRQSLLSPDGLTPKLQSPSFEGVVELIHRGIDTFVWDDHMPRRDFARRGVDDPQILPHYPYRDDSRPVWEAIHGFVEKYLRLYYPSDAAVVADQELRAWREALEAKDGAGVRGMVAIDGFDALAQLVAEIIFYLSALHCSVNYGVYEATAFEPHAPGAQYGPAPTELREYPEQDHLAMLPPLELTMDSLSDVYFVSNMRENRLGQYDGGYFEDHRVISIVHEFQRRLEQIEEQTRQRNQSQRPVPYTILLPSNITASICT